MTKTATTSLELQAAFVGLVRAFGLHHPDQTPCGVAVPVSEAHALAELLERGACCPSDLADALRLERSTVSRLVAQMEGKGWVAREAAPVDRRRRPVSLTPKGHRLAGEIAVARARRFAQILGNVPEAELEGVLDAVRRLTAAMEEV